MTVIELSRHQVLTCMYATIMQYLSAIESLVQSNRSIMKPVLKMKSHKLILFFQVTFETF